MDGYERTNTKIQQKQAEQWFKELRNQMVGAIQKLMVQFFKKRNGKDQAAGVV